MAIVRAEPADDGLDGADDFASKDGEQAPIKHRGRPPKKPEERMVRRTVLIDPRELHELREWYGAKTDAEAIRSAISSIVQLAALDDIQHYLAEHGGLDDVYDRTSGRSKLPVHLGPEDIPSEEREPALGDDAYGA